MDINGWHICILAIHTAKNQKIAVIGSMFDNKNHQKPQLIELMQPFRTPPRKGPEPKKHGQHHTTKQNFLKAFTILWVMNWASCCWFRCQLILGRFVPTKEIHWWPVTLWCWRGHNPARNTSQQIKRKLVGRSYKRIIIQVPQAFNTATLVSEFLWYFFSCHRVISWRLRPVRGWDLLTAGLHRYSWSMEL